MSDCGYNCTSDKPFTQGNIAIFKSYSGTTQGLGSAGVFFFAGFYDAPAADANLDEVSPTTTIGAENRALGAHAFIVAGGAGSAAGGAGAVEIEVSGISITDAGVRNAADTEILVADITTMSLNDYFETTKKWLGLVTFTLKNAGGSTQTTFSADFNYGSAKYDNVGSRKVQVKDFEGVWLSAANDAGFNIALCHHKPTGWIYSAAAFVAGAGSEIVQLSDDYSTDDNTDNGEFGAYERTGLSADIEGDMGEGVMIRMTTTANNAIEYIDFQIGYIPM